MNFYRCRLNYLHSKKILANDLLGVSLETLRDMARSSDDLYDEFYIYKNGKKRLVENPKPSLKRLHHRLKAILTDISLADYVVSGRKGLSYKDNAEAHVGNMYVCSFDIEKFFPSCTMPLVEKFFCHDLKMSRDVARVLARLVTYKGHIPTGSPISQILAYWVNYRAFNQIHEMARNRGHIFTLYVDDMTFSSDSKKFSRGFHVYVNFLLKKNGLRLKKSKVQYSFGAKPKVITGCVVDNSIFEVKAPNKLKNKIFKDLDKMKTCPVRAKDIRRVYGRLNAVRFIEGDVLSGLKYQFECEMEASAEYPT